MYVYKSSLSEGGYLVSKKNPGIRAFILFGSNIFEHIIWGKTQGPEIFS